MTFERKNAKRIEKLRLGYGQCTTQMDAKPFSIRRYVLKSRQRNIAQSWPFAQKYLKLCFDNSINNVLPPLETPSSPTNDLRGRLIIDLSLNMKEHDDFGKICRTKQEKREKSSKPEENFSLVDTIRLLCRKLDQLSLSFGGTTLVGHEQRLVAQKSDFHKKTCEFGRRRKRKTKLKSLAEILAVAKHCILDGNDRCLVSGRGSTASLVQNSGEQRKRKVKGMLSGLNSRSTDQFIKRSCTKGVIDYNRKLSSCQTAEIKKKPGGYKQKALGTYDSVSVVELQDYHAY